MQLDPVRAARAARIIASDPDELPQVFTIIESLSADTMYRIGARMLRSEKGRRLVSGRPDIVNILADRPALARMPEGSLGRAYLSFVEREKISADGIRAAEKEGGQNLRLPAPLDWVKGRMRDTHDLWHAATGYSGDVLGEIALLAFSFAQVWNPGVGLVVVIGLMKMGILEVGDKDEVRRTIWDGFRRGRKAAWLPEQEWESMLALPVEEVRKRLSLDAPPVYREMRSAELKAVLAQAA